MGTRITVWGRPYRRRLVWRRRPRRSCCVMLGASVGVAGCLLVFTAVWWWCPATLVVVVGTSAWLRAERLIDG